MGTERIKVKLLRPILAWFQEWAQKGWKWSSWGLFWSGSRSAERVKIKLLRLILAWFPKRAQRESKLSSWGLFWHGFRSGHRNDQSEALEGSCFNHHTTLWDVCFRVQLLRFLISCGNLYHWVVIETRPMRLFWVPNNSVFILGPKIALSFGCPKIPLFFWVPKNTAFPLGCPKIPLYFGCPKIPLFFWVPKNTAFLLVAQKWNKVPQIFSCGDLQRFVVIEIRSLRLSPVET